MVFVYFFTNTKRWGLRPTNSLPPCGDKELPAPFGVGPDPLLRAGDGPVVGRFNSGPQSDRRNSGDTEIGKKHGHSPLLDDHFSLCTAECNALSR